MRGSLILKIISMETHNNIPFLNEDAEKWFFTTKNNNLGSLKISG